jgi:hypothetical protein
MFSLKGHRIASRYFHTRVTPRLPARVSVKLEERGDHHRPARMVIGGAASPRA